MKNSIIMLTLALAMAMGGCKKNDDKQNEPDNQTFQQTQELSDVKGENDQANTDIDKVIEAFPSLKGGRIATDTTLNDICGCKIDRSQILNKKVILKFDGVTPCLSPSRVRAGNIVIELIAGSGWYKPGAIIKITFDNFRVTVEQSGKTIYINGVKYRKNISGLNWLAFLTGQDSLVFQERGNGMQVTVNNHGPHVYNLARRTVAYLKRKQNQWALHVKAYGDTNINNLTSVDAWGTTKSGLPYFNTFDEPWVCDAYCWFSRPTSGKYTYRFNNNTISVTLGVDKNGAKDTRDCAYGWKVVWTNANGASGQRIISY